MGKEFEIVREFTVAATPEQVWEALTDGTAGWLWPLEYEHRLGGAAAFGGTVTAWDPPHRFTNRAESGDWYNQLDHTIQRHEDGAWVRYVHSGVFTDDWENQYDGADRHTDFYLHTLKQYLLHFAGRAATYAAADGPEASKRPGSFARAVQALGLRPEVSEGDRVHVDVPGLDPMDATVDYRNEWFLGLRTDTAMYRLFGRDAFGQPVAVTVHHFGDADQKHLAQSWQSWLDGIYA